MLRRKRVDILFAIAYIVLLCILIALIKPSMANGEECSIETEMDVPEETDELIEEVAEDIEEVMEEEQELYKSLGIFNVTAYCPCKECSGRWGYQTATGVIAKEGVTIAVDPSVIPYGTKVYIDGHEYIAQDCGGAIKGNDIDVFFEDHEVAKKWGVQEKEVFILAE